MSRAAGDTSTEVAELMREHQRHDYDALKARRAGDEVGQYRNKMLAYHALLMAVETVVYSDRPRLHEVRRIMARRLPL